MLICFPFHHVDRDQMEALARWIEELGAGKNHDAILIHDVTTNTQGILEPMQRAFREVTIFIVPDVPEADWQSGNGDASACNEMWINTAWHIFYNHKRRWFWNEPDCCPTRSTSYDELEADDLSAAKPYTGAYVVPSSGEPRMSGVAVYPDRVCDFGGVKAMQSTRIPWDVVGGDEFVKRANFTQLIQHELRPHNQKPTFPDEVSMKLLRPEAAFFHPCRDGSLIDHLRERRKTELFSDIAKMFNELPPPPEPSWPPGAIEKLFSAHEFPKNQGVIDSRSIAEKLRYHCGELASIVDGNISRKQTLHSALRSAGLLGAAKKRKKA